MKKQRSENKEEEKTTTTSLSGCQLKTRDLRGAFYCFISSIFQSQVSRRPVLRHQKIPIFCVFCLIQEEEEEEE